MNAPVSSLSQHAALPARDDDTVLPTPEALHRDISLAAPLAGRIRQQRQAIRDILDGRDDRLLVVVGPCSIHDPRPLSTTLVAWPN
ncbi:phospho-2-dehydro-3-deoxyheptonate aldolase, Tyr-sensitive [Halomonas elongata]|uniref:3-deoxy-7-phosphoheptulonate synthase n=1 Tax=Halomonas elongata TaxID=2746 RepID=A0A1B8NX14_HALEL|nr:phospho-2-dehydro-3-deoxyheptonate aldolase, Tyr-sensitive [Halomonas elongata]